MAGQDAAQADDELAELANQMADGAMLTLHRLLEGGDKEFVDEQPVAGFSVGGVARRFGGGRYVIYLRKPDPEIAGKSIRQGSKRFTIAGPPKYPTADPIAGAPAIAVAGETAKLSATYGEMIQAGMKAQLESADMLQKMQLAVLASLTNRPPDPTAELLKTLLPLIAGKRDNGITIADAIALGDRMANRNGPAASLKETLELLQTARELGGGEAPAPAWMGVAAKAIEVIGRAITYNPRQLPAGETADDTAPPPALPPAPLEVPTVAPTAHPLLHFLAPQMPGLMDHAQADHNPDNYAGPIVDQIPVQHAAGAVEYLASEGFMPQLLAAFPMTAPLQAWFTELRDCVVDRLNEKLNPPADDAGPELVK